MFMMFAPLEGRRHVKVTDRHAAIDYLKRRGWKETGLNRKYMSALRLSVMSLYELSDVKPSESFLARDLVRDGDPVRVFASRSVDAQFRIPIANPEKQIYGYELTVSLDGAEALAEKGYEGVEYKTERNVHLDIGMIHGATAIVVGYQGPVATKRTLEIMTKPTTPAIGFPFPMPVPETTIVIDSQKIGANDVIRELSWQADSLVAEIREESDNRPIGPPGEGKKPICGQSVHNVKFKATPDFQRRLVSFEVIETYSSDCHCDDEIDCFETHQSTRFAATNLPVIDFGDHCIRFGIDDARLLQQYCAEYHHRSTSKAYLSNSNWDLDENLPDKFAAEAKIGFYIEFRL